MGPTENTETANAPLLISVLVLMQWTQEFHDVLSEVPEEHFDRERFVPAIGPLDADLMFIGEAPGANEVVDGEPFTGRSGEVLDELFAEVGIARESVYITATVKVRPPRNRDPYRDEIEAWWPVVEGEIARLDPALIVTLGRIATRELLATDSKITGIRGEVVHRLTETVLPTFHPAATLYDPSKRDDLREDLAKAAKFVKS